MSGPDHQGPRWLFTGEGFFFEKSDNGGISDEKERCSRTSGFNCVSAVCLAAGLAVAAGGAGSGMENVGIGDLCGDPYRCFNYCGTLERLGGKHKDHRTESGIQVWSRVLTMAPGATSIKTNENKLHSSNLTSRMSNLKIHRQKAGPVMCLELKPPSEQTFH